MSGAALKTNQHYTAEELDRYVSENDVILLSSNSGELFTDYNREYKVLMELEGYFEQSGNEKAFREKRAYVLEKA
ncbi:hypothetical protein GKZ89_20050 [Bacillus mangrovi]|uniref:Uncharacterized protein n=1 Tax=Metabacillus mangrovi TaxID=1491830 RepID=A0A7X2V6B4_9BACI|nr:hypothetical protein [Metabacillus mangrovi]MTH55692.1 hypothetical protein [Metabacillus mangrovi]